MTQRPKQMNMVFDALKEYGPMTSTDLEACIDLRLPSISAHLSELFAMGLIERLRKTVRYARSDNHSLVGPKSFIYKIKGDKRMDRQC